MCALGLNGPNGPKKIMGPNGPIGQGGFINVTPWHPWAKGGFSAEGFINVILQSVFIYAEHGYVRVSPNLCMCVCVVVLPGFMPARSHGA